MKDGTDTRGASVPEVTRRARMVRSAGEFVRREARVALPAAKRAAGHAAQAFFRKFSEEYAKENRKRKNSTN